MSDFHAPGLTVQPSLSFGVGIEYGTLEYMATKRNTIIFSLGGSLIAGPNGINVLFLKRFNAFIRKHVARGARFFIVCGGGRTAREYAAAAKAVNGARLTDEDLDWLGIHATRLNAHLIRTIFRDIAYPRLIKDYRTIPNGTARYSVVVGAGWKPGWSTDYDAVMLAKRFGVKTVINLTNTDLIYDKDPRNFKDAKPIPRLTWNEVLKIIGKKWKPGMNAPFDPVAAKLAKRLGLVVISCNGGDLKNLENVLRERKFVGTVIE